MDISQRKCFITKVHVLVSNFESLNPIKQIVSRAEDRVSSQISGRFVVDIFPNSLHL